MLPALGVKLNLAWLVPYYSPYTGMPCMSQAAGRNLPGHCRDLGAIVSPRAGPAIARRVMDFLQRLERGRGAAQPIGQAAVGHGSLNQVSLSCIFSSLR